MDDLEQTFDILFVCTGNQCRSALAAVMTRSLTDSLPVTVSSAGTLATRPTPSPLETVKAASTLGYPLAGHLSTPLAEVDAAASDLVVGFELAHVAAAVIEHGTDKTKTFLLRPLVAMLEMHASPVAHGGTVATARALVAAADERRGTAVPTLADQIADPMGRSARTHMETARTIDDLCRRLVTHLFPSRH